jgi:hypothetical protein
VDDAVWIPAEDLVGHDNDNEQDQPTKERRSSRIGAKPRRTWDPKTHTATRSSHTADDLPIPSADKVEKVILFHSRQTKDEEKRYHITELELAGLTHAVLKTQAYIDGAMTYVVTDHAPLRSVVYSDSPTMLSQRINKYRMLLQPFLPNLHIIYKPGKHHHNVDILSRLPVPDDDKAPRS